LPVQLRADSFRNVPHAFQSLFAEAKEENIGRLQNEHEARIADQRHADAEIETGRDNLVQLSDELNEVQKRFYDYGTEIARIEDGIQFQNERSKQVNTDLEQVSENWRKVEVDLENDEQVLFEIREEIAETEPRQKEIEKHEERSGTNLLEAEQAMQRWQHEWDEFNHAAAEARQEGEVEGLATWKSQSNVWMIASRSLRMICNAWKT